MMSPPSRFIRCINSRAVVDLPQPDSPTMPTVSPLAIANETSSTARTVLVAPNRSPRTGKCLVRPLTCSSGCATPPRSSILSSASAVELIVIGSIPDVHRAAHAIAEQVKADRYCKDNQTWQRRHPRIDVNRRAQGVEHQPPFRLRRLGPEAEERQARGQNHGNRYQPGRIDENRPQHVAEHVHAHDGEGPGSGGARRLDEVHVAHAGGDALSHSRDLRDKYNRQRNDGVDDAGAERA